MKRLWMPVMGSLLLATGCGGGDHQHPDAGTELSCQDDPRVLALEPGAAVNSASGARRVTLVSATPAEPSRGENAWTVRVEDASGQALSELALTVTPFMPDHNHGPSSKPTIEARGDGTYAIGALDFFMPGIWRVTFDAPAPEDDPASFFVCVEG